MKFFLYINISIFMLFIAGVWNMRPLPDRPAAAAQAGVSSVSVSIPAKPKRSKIWTRNVILHKGETLVLHFAAPNPPYLGVIDPKGHFFYLVFPGEFSIGDLKPLVESKSFASLKTLKINSDLLKADPYIYGVEDNQPVFTTSGTYTFIMGENLHVDDPELLDKVSMQYVHAFRPAGVSIIIATN